MSFECSKLECSSPLDCTETDSRGEWCEWTYVCPECGAIYCERRDYDQNGLVISDTFEREYEHYNIEFEFKSNKYTFGFRPDSADYWEGFKRDGKKFDIQFDEECNTIQVFPYDYENDQIDVNTVLYEREIEVRPKEFLIGIVLNFGMHVTADSKEKAKEAVYDYLSDPVDNSTEKQREEGRFFIEDIKCHEREIVLCDLK